MGLLWLFKLVVFSFRMRELIVFIGIFLPNILFAQWQKVKLDTKSSFRALKAFESHLWAGGTKGTILHAEGNLDHVQVIQVPGAEKLDFRDLAILPNQQILAMSAGPSEGGAAVVFYSNDLGKTWLKVFELKEPGYFFDAILYDEASSKGYLLSDPINQKLTLFSFDLNLEFKPIEIKNAPAMLPKEAFFAASGSSMQVFDDRLYLVTGGSERARIWRSTDLEANSWEVVSDEVMAGPNRGFFSMACGKKECMVAGGDYTKINSAEIPVLRGDGKTFSRIDGSPGIYVEKVLPVGKHWWFAGPAGTVHYRPEKKSFVVFDQTPLHNIVSFKKWMVGIGKELVFMKQ